MDRQRYVHVYDVPVGPGGGTREVVYNVTMLDLPMGG